MPESKSEWMIYGATGFTGELVVAEAVQRGHRPLLAGRSAARLAPLADKYGLPLVAFALTDAAALANAVAQVKLVYHCAGPFVETAQPMIQACLQAGVHYLDITGEIPVYQYLFAQQADPRSAAITAISGVGYDLIPSDGLLRYVADQVPAPTHAQIVIGAFESSGGNLGISAGTAKSLVGLSATLGMVVRRDNQLVPHWPDSRRFRTLDGDKSALAIPWGDVEMGYHTAAIPNITCYLTLPRLTQLGMQMSVLTAPLLKLKAVRSAADRLLERVFKGPSADSRAHDRTTLYARVWNAQGEMAQAWMETAEGYRFTALAAPLVVERVLRDPPHGICSPAGALGADFALSIAGTKRYDQIP